MMKKTKVSYATSPDPEFSTAEFVLNPELFEVREQDVGQVLVMKHVEVEYFPTDAHSVLGDFLMDWVQDRGMNRARIEEVVLEEIRKQQLIQILAERL